MHKYFIKTPWLAKKLFPEYTWSIDTMKDEIFLSFDDGPHPVITPWVLDQLKEFNAKASFFCIGNNVEKYPEVYNRIIEEGHAVGNHTWSHISGWKTPVKSYLADISRAAEVIDTNLFRPPYGRIRSVQASGVSTAMRSVNAKIIMWDVLSADFDKSYSPEKCLDNVLSNYVSGSIVVFHDSEKAFTNLKYVLPRVLKHLKEEGFDCRKLDLGIL